MAFDPLGRAATPCEVVPFPAKNRIGHIRKTADRVFHSRTDREANDYWQRATDGLSRQMAKAGVEPVRIAIELRAFHDALRNEVGRLGYAESEPGDAA